MARATAWAVAPDGARVAALDPERRLLLYSVDGGDPAPVRGAQDGDVPLRFTPDGRALYVFVRGDGPRSEIHRVDLATGERQVWKELAPPDPVGVFGVPSVQVSADGQSYVYAYVRLLDELYLVDGLR